MAEFAQRSIEEMLIEVEKMKKVGLFTQDETRAIMKKRKRFEYKLQRRTKEKDVFLQYIHYEIGVYQLVKLRREKKRIELGRDEIDKAVALRIYKLFRIACFRFKSDVKLWLTHIDFAKKNMDKERVSKIFTTMLQVHNKKPNLWIMAAKFELETNESIETARLLFQRALRFLPTNFKIWTEYFKMELLCVEMIIKRKELLGIENDPGKNSSKENPNKLEEDSILNCKVVEVVFKMAIKQIKENVPELIHAFILIAMKFEFANDLVESMFKLLSEDETLSKNEQSWDILARRHLITENEILKKCKETGQVADFTIAEFEEKANQVFLDSLTNLNTKKMHEIYIEFCFQRLNFNSKFLNEERFNRLNEAFKITDSKFGLQIDMIIRWIEILIKFNKIDQAIELLDKSLVSNKENVDLWKYSLRIKMDQNPNQLMALFYKALESVKTKESFEIWQLIIDWALLNNHNDIENILETGSKIMNKEIASFSRCKYLTWAMQQHSDSIKKVREVYKSLRQIPPYSVEFFFKYIEIEKCTSKVDEKIIKNAYEDALVHFDTENIDLWLSYIEFEYFKVSKNTEYVAELYRRATKKLNNNDLVESFTQRFHMLKLDLITSSSSYSSK